MKFLNNGGEDVWAAVMAAKLKIPAALAPHRILEMRQQTVAAFAQHAKAKDWSEADWQEFFRPGRTHLNLSITIKPPALDRNYRDYAFKTVLAGENGALETAQTPTTPSLCDTGA